MQASDRHLLCKVMEHLVSSKGASVYPLEKFHVGIQTILCLINSSCTCSQIVRFSERHFFIKEIFSLTKEAPGTLVLSPDHPGLDPHQPHPGSTSPSCQMPALLWPLRPLLLSPPPLYPTDLSLSVYSLPGTPALRALTTLPSRGAICTPSLPCVLHLFSCDPRQALLFPTQDHPLCPSPQPLLPSPLFTLQAAFWHSLCTGSRHP